MIFHRTMLLPLIITCHLLSGCGATSDESLTSETADTPDTSSTENTVTSALVINEIVAASHDGADWIELYATGASVNLSD